MGVDAQHGELVVPSPLEIVAVPAFADNYLWLIHVAGSGETAVVDPGDPAPVLAEAERRGHLEIALTWNDFLGSSSP